MSIPKKKTKKCPKGYKVCKCHEAIEMCKKKKEPEKKIIGKTKYGLV